MAVAFRTRGAGSSTYEPHGRGAHAAALKVWRVKVGPFKVEGFWQARR
jgi:hypothetical protein